MSISYIDSLLAICFEASAGPLPHVAVVNRPVGETWVPSLVFGEVHQGEYVLVHKGEEAPQARVAVRGGEVTWAVWPDPA